MASCQSGFHNQTTLHTLQYLTTDFGDGVTVNITLCNVCYNTLSRASQDGVDLTMSVIYQWAEECGILSSLSESLRRCFRNCAEIAHFVNIQISNIRQRQVNRNESFPMILKGLNEKSDFIDLIVNDESTVKKILHDIDSGKDRKYVALRLYAGCMDAAKCTRDSHNSATGFVEYTKEKRLAGSVHVKKLGDQDSIYAAGAKAALPFEFLFNRHKERFLENIPTDSIIRGSLKEASRSKDVVTPEDIVTVF